MKIIKLSKSEKYITVDDEDFGFLTKWKWRLSKTGYAERTTWYPNSRKRRKIVLHRLLMNLDVGDKLQVDHIDGNKLNNQRSNLRICSVSQNNANRSIGKNNTTGYKGVVFKPKLNKFLAQIKVNKKIIELGYFYDKKDAAIAYNKAAIKYFGPFAKLNPINLKFEKKYDEEN